MPNCHPKNVHSLSLWYTPDERYTKPVEWQNPRPTLLPPTPRTNRSRGGAGWVCSGNLERADYQQKLGIKFHLLRSVKTARCSDSAGENLQTRYRPGKFHMTNALSERYPYENLPIRREQPPPVTNPPLCDGTAVPLQQHTRGR